MTVFYGEGDKDNPISVKLLTIYPILYKSRAWGDKWGCESVRAGHARAWKYHHCFLRTEVWFSRASSIQREETQSTFKDIGAPDWNWESWSMEGSGKLHLNWWFRHMFIGKSHLRSLYLNCCFKHLLKIAQNAEVMAGGKPSLPNQIITAVLNGKQSQNLWYESWDIIIICL